jgi:hypothetical protein
MIIHVQFGLIRVSTFKEKIFVPFSIWSYVKTLSYSSGYLGFRIDTYKNQIICKGQSKEHSTKLLLLKGLVVPEKKNSKIYFP